MKDENKQMMQFRAKEELKIKLLKVILDFKSKEEPEYELTGTDVINVLCSMVTRQTE